MIKVKIKDRFNGNVIYVSNEAETLREAVIEAVQTNVDLRIVDLSYTDLSDANLRDVDLTDYASLLEQDRGKLE